MSALSVVVDGAPLGNDEARAFWKRFSDWMEERRGDLAGFACAEGFASVHPEMRGDGPMLVVSRSEPQRAYQSAAKNESGGDRALGGGPRSGNSNRAALPVKSARGKREKRKR